MSRIRVSLYLAILLAMAVVSCSRTTSAPDAWYRGYPLYEVYLRSFTPEGTLKAAMEKLPVLHERGIRNLWLMPLQPTGELGRKGTYGSPYSIRDYLAVGGEYGTMDDLKAFVKKAHDLKMHVILDVVMNHAANDNNQMADHPDWFMRDKEGNFAREVADWSDITDWNFENPETQAYLKSVLTFYLKDVGLDGFRCDVAGMVPDTFWQSVNAELREMSPGVFLLAEWAEPRMIEDGFDATYDWDWYHRMKDHAEGKISTDSLWKTFEKWQNDYPAGAEGLRFIENHDEKRATEVFGADKSLAYAALCFTMPGIPLIYNGQEVGATERPSLFEKDPITWEQGEGGPVESAYKALLELRNTHEVLRRGDVWRLPSEGSEKVLVFLRNYQGIQAVVAVNLGAEGATVKLTDLSRLTSPRKLLPKQAFSKDSPQPELQLSGYGYGVYIR